MNMTVKFVTAFLLVGLTSGIALAGEIYIWTDKTGMLNITNVEPLEPVNIVAREGYKAASPYELRRYEAYRKQVQRRLDIEERHGRIMQDYYKSADDYQRAGRDAASAAEKRQQKEARYRAEDAALEKERLQARENNNYREVRRIWKKQDELWIERRAQSD